MAAGFVVTSSHKSGDHFYYGGEAEDVMSFLARVGGCDDFTLFNMRLHGWKVVDSIRSRMKLDNETEAIVVMHVEHVEQVNHALMTLVTFMRNEGWVVNVAFRNEVKHSNWGF